MFKTGKSIFRLLFLIVLLVGNAIGFHYYHAPVAIDNLRYIPSNSTFVFTVNLKNISGTILQEMLFRPDGFEKEIISKSERKLFQKNSSLGINPFGLVSFFRFEYNNQIINGISFNLEDVKSYGKEMNRRNLKFNQIDEVKAFYNDEVVNFVFDKAAVLLFTHLEEKEMNELAGQLLLNENLFTSDLSQGHFSLYTRKDLWKNSAIEPYFRMVPEFAESMTVSGLFERESIHLSGEISLNKSFGFNDEIVFKKVGEREFLPMEFNFSGSEISKIIAAYLSEKIDSNADTTNTFSNITDESYEGLRLSLKDVRIPFDLNMINSFVKGGIAPSPEYSLQMDLTESGKNDPSLLNYNFLLSLKEGNDPKRRVFCKIFKNKTSTQAYFYFNPIRFIEEADLNILVKTLMDPFMVFDEVFLSADKLSKGKLSFEGKISLVDSEKHSMIQMRQLIKDFTSIL